MTDGTNRNDRAGACIEEMQTAPETGETGGGAAFADPETTGAAQGTETPAGPVETFGVTCPLCGGSLRVHEGERSIACEYCGSGLVVTRPHGVRSFMVQPRITPGKARITALHRLAAETGGRVKARHASIVDIKLIHVPFWRMHGRLMGWVCGDTITMREVDIPVPGTQSERTVKTVREERHPFARLVFKRVDWSTPACTLRALGLQGISLKTRMLHWDIFDHELRSDHQFALPMKSARQARGDAFKYLTRIAAPAHSRVRASRFHLADSTLSLYYYPVYFIRYRHAGRIYTITIDGSDGRVVHGETPRRRAASLKAMFFVPAAIAFLAQTFLPLILVAAGVLYVFDAVQTQGFLPPHRWLAARLDRWFGGDW
ncbi:MAG TPA: hypothetical protein VMX58_13530 [Patescibacteria group bacterium]|nr:hypothetical protein [Patescibacteria group bacterium]